MRVKGRDNAYRVTTMADGSLCFPLSWIEDSKTVIVFNFEYPTPFEREVTQVLDEFKFTSSHTKIILDRGEGSEIDKYMGKFIVIETFILRLFTRKTLMFFFSYTLFERKCFPFNLSFFSCFPNNNE